MTRSMDSVGDDSSIELLAGLASTRTIRRYTSDPVPPDDLNSILWHATRAPSGSNRQPVRYLALVDGPRAARAKSLLGESFRRGWSAKLRQDGYDLAVCVAHNTPIARRVRQNLSQYRHPICARQK